MSSAAKGGLWAPLVVKIYAKNGPHVAPPARLR
ncbi:hypothetical protein Hmuk_2089 [Halomicrobium mukohataei DSM 12286]|uniref:Uncharacterized protein n=1 Tax=Halomicrobium mukohataei (strain ATCC 700874 / DSM 12286 / JCM 9738 / NCIMB 13541) TaxID=485914 RepID=C7NW73_HALMD|nr:hypothetical protein Hmuk_2089 [Halomicrobium mukohataei DSM 12286]